MVENGRRAWLTPVAVLVAAAALCGTMAYGDAAGREAATAVRNELMLTRGELAALREVVERRR